MHPQKIEGHWHGFFIYGDGYSPALFGEKVSFKIDLSVSGKLLTGTCKDEIADKLFETPATIEGEYESRSISFVKKYPCQVLVGENNHYMAIREHPSAEIYYEGQLFKNLISRQVYFEGDWSITTSYPNEYDETSYHTVRGTWRMEKVK